MTDEKIKHDLQAVTPTQDHLSEIIAGTAMAIAAVGEVAGDESLLPEVVIAKPPLVAASEDAPEPAEPEIDPEIAAIQEEMEQLNEDFESTRENLQDIIRRGTKAVEEAAIVAQSSDHHKAYEALATLINAMTTANERMIDLHKARQKMLADARKAKNHVAWCPPHQRSLGDQSGSFTPGGGNTTNNVVFVGSTADLIQQVLNQKAKKVVDVTGE